MNSAQLMQGVFAAYSRVRPEAAAERARRMMMTPAVPPSLRELPPALAERRIQLDAETSMAVRGHGPSRVLLVHGWSSGGAWFEPLVERLAPERYSVYLLQPPGHGDSRARESHPGRFLHAIELAADYLDDRIDVAVGHSMGAATLARVAIHRPGIGAVALLAGPASFEQVIRRTAAWLGMGRRSEAAFLQRMAEIVGIPFPALDLSQHGRQLRQPALIVHDREDREIPFADAELLRNVMPAAELLATAGCGHRRLLRSAEVVDALVAFIDRHASARVWRGAAATAAGGSGC